MGLDSPGTHSGRWVSGLSWETSSGQGEGISDLFFSPTTLTQKKPVGLGWTGASRFETHRLKILSSPPGRPSSLQIIIRGIDSFWFWNTFPGRTSLQREGSLGCMLQSGMVGIIASVSGREHAVEPSHLPHTREESVKGRRKRPGFCNSLQKRASSEWKTSVWSCAGWFVST